MDDLSKHPANNAIRSPKTRAIGIAIAVMGLLVGGFDDYWKPIAFAELLALNAPNWVVGLVPYTSTLLLFVGMGLMLRSHGRLTPTQN